DQLPGAYPRSTTTWPRPRRNRWYLESSSSSLKAARDLSPCTRAARANGSDPCRSFHRDEAEEEPSRAWVSRFIRLGDRGDGCGECASWLVVPTDGDRVVVGRLYLEG